MPWGLKVMDKKEQEEVVDKVTKDDTNISSFLWHILNQIIPITNATCVSSKSFPCSPSPAEVLNLHPLLADDGRHVRVHCDRRPWLSSLERLARPFRVLSLHRVDPLHGEMPEIRLWGVSCKQLLYIENVLKQYQRPKNNTKIHHHYQGTRADHQDRKRFSAAIRCQQLSYFSEMSNLGLVRSNWLLPTST